MNPYSLTNEERHYRNMSIAKASARGVSHSELAREYGLSRATITIIVRDTKITKSPTHPLNRLGEDYAKSKLKKFTD